ncbi:MAG: 50S ribosomal protein L15 [Myxococcota bacterium]|nr:50S ribosomal protein L15 [Myxococcota bacterium]
MQLYDLPAPAGANKKRKRVGRGESSGHGKTSGRGHKGQGARTGKGKPGPGFEGGQMPMYRRMPKRGFTNVFAKETAALNVDVLAAHFAAGERVDMTTLKAKGLVKKKTEVVRILGRGELTIALTLKVDHVTPGAKQKIEAAGGTIEA